MALCQLTVGLRREKYDMSIRRKAKSVETLKARYGLIFISPWIVGIILFFLFPIIQSIYFSFAHMSIGSNGVKTEFIGLENFDNIIRVNPDYINNLVSGLENIVVSLPLIIVISLILALFLNNAFHGRLFFRSLFFLPVILASGLVLELFLNAAAGNATEVALSDSVSFGIIDVSEVLRGLQLPVSIEGYLSAAIGSLFMIVWQTGIQILLFIAGLQSIPDLLYEVAKVEGATKWEEFWFITLPMLLRTMLLVVVFTIVELITSKTNPVITQGYNQFNNLEFGRGSAMLWLYFSIAGLFMAILFLLYNKLFFRKWG